MIDNNDEMRERRRVFLQYPRGARNQVALVADDLEALNPGEFLNDTIIDFYLR